MSTIVRLEDLLEDLHLVAVRLEDLVGDLKDLLEDLKT